MSELVWLNGMLRRPEGAIDASDRGFTLGDGVFETMFWTGTRVRGFGRHMARLANGCAGLFLPPPPSSGDIAGAIDQLIDASHLRGSTAAIRLTMTRGPAGRGLALPKDAEPTVLIAARPFMPSTEPLHAWLSDLSRPAGNPSAMHKTLAYGDAVIALHRAQQAGCTEALLLGPEGRIACASAGNIIVVTVDGAAVTPPQTDGALAGTTRALLLDRGLIREGTVDQETLAGARCVLVCNALHGLRPVATIHGFGGDRFAGGVHAYPTVDPAMDQLTRALAADDA